MIGRTQGVAYSWLVYIYKSDAVFSEEIHKLRVVPGGVSYLDSLGKSLEGAMETLDMEHALLGSTKRPRKLKNESCEFAGFHKRLEAVNEGAYVERLDRAALVSEPLPKLCAESETGTTFNLPQPSLRLSEVGRAIESGVYLHHVHIPCDVTQPVPGDAARINDAFPIAERPSRNAELCLLKGGGISHV